MTKMVFTEHKRYSGGAETWISGIYKVVQYGDHWFAYFKPYRWPNWGNSCECIANGRVGHDSKRYDSKEDAMAACERHKTKFGEDPNDTNRIWV